MKTNRRQFLKKAAVGAAAMTGPTIIPASVLGANAPSKRVNLAAIGCGNRAHALVLVGFGQLDGARVTAAVDPFRDRRDQLAAQLNQRYGGDYCKAYEDYREVVNREDIDGVVIATPDHWHVPIALAAARAGKDMYVEKPLSIAMNWAKLLRKEVEVGKVIFQYGTQQRSGAAARRAVELVWNGHIGEIQRVDVYSPHLAADASADPAEQPVPEGLNYDLWLGPAPQRPFSPARVNNKQGTWHCYDYALGFIAGWGAHPLDILQWGLQTDHTAPVEVEGKGFLKPGEELLNTVRTWDLAMKYADGTPVRFMDTATARPMIKPMHERMQGDGTIFHGTDGWVCYQRGSCWVKKGGGDYLRPSEIKRGKNERRAYVSDSQHGNFVDCMKSRKPTINPLESAIRSDTISHLGDIAVRTGSKLRYDPEEEVIRDNPEAAAMLDRPAREPYGVF